MCTYYNCLIAYLLTAGSRVRCILVAYSELSLVRSSPNFFHGPMLFSPFSYSYQGRIQTF